MTFALIIISALILGCAAVAMALRRVRTIASWPTRVVKSTGRYLRART